MPMDKPGSSCEMYDCKKGINRVFWALNGTCDYSIMAKCLPRPKNTEGRETIKMFHERGHGALSYEALSEAIKEATDQGPLHHLEHK